ADGSVGSPHARVGNCQASNKKKPFAYAKGFFLFLRFAFSTHKKPRNRSGALMLRSALMDYLR
ncbi:hypothetical protein, partial [Pantoea septica]|uniref:hypothetical protein n=1 Tax=Pantoea septica TaxID=472695 RepID=UPI002899860C